MAEKVIRVLVDDLDGGEADETVKFGLDGINYEIDLSKEHAASLRAALASYIASGRRIGRSTTSGRTGTSSRGRGPATTDREQNRAIREWAKRKGLKISERGRIAQEIVEQYHAEAGR